MFSLIKLGFSYIFGGKDKELKSISTVMSVAKGVGNFIDKQSFTAEEKSIANAKTLDTVLEAVKATQNENSVRSITRRVLAWAIMGSLLLAFWIAVFQKIFFNIPPTDILLIIEKFGLGNLALAVGSFYFMASLIRK